MDETDVKNYNSLDRLLSNNKPTDDSPWTHTRIGDTKLDIYPASYSIPDSYKNQFYELY